ncbi:hypothetical protein PALU110988_10650 [Paenibacillus lupini]|uniref:hypothetical protein n=1 Tax=Paenibacillus lupini TaxID=1450204 RepID=UPI0014208C15|nr:hypothetical protein [Paenibacillus lupini]NIK22396.1 hypothetical protein [Paenibacillus lupini]
MGNICIRKYILILLTLSLLGLLIVGCSKTTAYGTPIPIKKLTWGMNEEEVKEALHISELDITKWEKIFIFHKQMELYNRTADVAFYFSEYHTLYYIVATFKQEDIAYVQKAVTKKRGEGEYSFDANGDPVMATVNWNDDLLETNKKWLTEVEEVYHKLGAKISNDPMEGGFLIRDRPITSWRLTLNKNSPLYSTLTFDGSFVSMLNYPERYVPITK